MTDSEPDPAADPKARLAEATAWVFDLDNTLYAASFDLFAQIDVRMKSYIADFLGLDPESAYQVQKQYFHDYGTSLRGLMHHHRMDPAPFLEFVHDIDVTVLPPSPDLDAALDRLPGRKLIFTNASAAHAERVVERLGIARHFEAVYDIVAADHRPKPEPAVYEDLVIRHGIDASRSVMVEDMARNLAPAAALGMTTVWVRTGSEWGQIGAEDGHVHHVTDDLTAWLGEVIGVTNQPGN